jgi:putative hydrolase of the HAD superfamily
MSLLFVFDMDDVLYDYDWRVRMAGMTELTGLTVQQMRERWWHDDGEWAAEAGEWRSGEAYLAAFNAAIDGAVTAEDWVRVRGSAMTPRPAAIAAVERAAELGTVSLLTNNGALTQEHLGTLAPDLVDVFGEHLLTSSFYGARKPDPVVFERVLARHRARAEDTFFADDLVANVEGARSVGITAHLYTDPESLLAAIEAFAAARAEQR